ncbi:beta-lactamase [Scopulibacillus darangshiensis]|uniref:Beta-lactamase n=1 Tax=Scopulibacillus darangshiensis TaxID=442528 RepID=A0A4V2SNI2_9BACL|nr:beta-lactamase [Scopulibacillus darangshiensis]
MLEAGTHRKVNANTLFHASPISKMVSAIGVLRLVQEGVLGLDQDRVFSPGPSPFFI